MLGGGFSRSLGKGLDQLAEYDDSITDPLTECHLSGMITTLFGENGRNGSVKNIWSDIICYTPDSLPYVGKLDHRLTGRKVGAVDGEVKDEPAEWISAGYHGGDGLCMALWSRIARMDAGSQDEDLEERPRMPSRRVADWFPKELLVSNKRVQDGDILDIAS